MNDYEVQFVIKGSVFVSGYDEVGAFESANYLIGQRINAIEEILGATIENKNNFIGKDCEIIDLTSQTDEHYDKNYVKGETRYEH